MNEPEEIQCVHCKKMIPNDYYGIHDCDPDNPDVDVVKVLEAMNDG